MRGRILISVIIERSTKERRAQYGKRRGVGWRERGNECVAEDATLIVTALIVVRDLIGIGEKSVGEAIICASLQRGCSIVLSSFKEQWSDSLVLVRVICIMYDSGNFSFEEENLALVLIHRIALYLFVSDKKDMLINTNVLLILMRTMHCISNIYVLLFSCYEESKK